MRDARGVLVDDGPGIKLGSCIVRGGADDLHAALVRAVVGARALERCGQCVDGVRWWGGLFQVSGFSTPKGRLLSQVKGFLNLGEPQP